MQNNGRVPAGGGGRASFGGTVSSQKNRREGLDILRKEFIRISGKSGLKLKLVSDGLKAFGGIN